MSKTRIFARPLPASDDASRQLLVYSMNLEAAEDLAMVLPIPVPPGSPEDAVRFVNLEAVPRFFEELDVLFPIELSRNMQAFGPPQAAPLKTLVVHEVGAFEASFVPTPGDFVRLDERFRLPERVWDALPDYADWGFCVFKLRVPQQVASPIEPVEEPPTKGFGGDSSSHREKGFSSSDAESSESSEPPRTRKGFSSSAASEKAGELEGAESSEPPRTRKGLMEKLFGLFSSSSASSASSDSPSSPAAVTSERKYHPMAFEFPRRDPARLFLPTLHIHDGTVHPQALFDHSLYVQTGHDGAPATTRDRTWTTSMLPAQTFPPFPPGMKKTPRAIDWLDEARPVYRLTLGGTLPNRDTFV